MLTKGAFVSTVAQMQDPEAESIPFVNARGDVVWNKEESSASLFAVLYTAGEVFDKDKSLSANMRALRERLDTQAEELVKLSTKLAEVWPDRV